MMHWVYLAACLMLPALWGLFVAKLYNWLSDRRKKSDPQLEEPVEMYHI